MVATLAGVPILLCDEAAIADARDARSLLCDEAAIADARDARSVLAPSRLPAQVEAIEIALPTLTTSTMAFHGVEIDTLRTTTSRSSEHLEPAQIG
jgi:hypothetical protein